MSTNNPSEWYLFFSGPDKACCYILDSAHKTELSMNTLYELCTSHMQYFITLLIHQNFNPCINPTSLMDMPVPIGTFHSMFLTTETYATYIYIHTHTHTHTHTHYIMLCKAVSILSPYICIFLQHLTS